MPKFFLQEEEEVRPALTQLHRHDLTRFSGVRNEDESGGGVFSRY
jgi:hypothetical protein